MAEINNALVAETAPKAAQVVPSVEYCHVPLPTLLVIAIPLKALVSTSAQVALARMELAVVPVEVVSSFVEVRVIVPVLIVGASLTLLTVMLDVAVAVLNAVVPPLDAVVTLVPVAPVVWSQAQKVTEADVPFWAFGTSRK